MLRTFQMTLVYSLFYPYRTRYDRASLDVLSHQMLYGENDQLYFSHIVLGMMNPL